MGAAGSGRPHARLRTALETAGYTAAALRARLGAAAANPAPADVELLERRLGSDEVAVLARFLLLQLPAQPDELARSVGADAVDDLAELGLAVEEDGRLRAPYRLVPHPELLLASDGFPGPAGTAPDHVSGLTQAARVCANLTPRARVASALDLGTGCGTHALLAARHAERVVATDVNPRALALAALNARLNGIDNVELREGSLFEPVLDERFDLVVSNAPFVVSPGARFAYRDGGLPGDGFSARLAAEAPAHLCEGGFAVLMLSWIPSGGVDPFSRPRSWVEGRGCDGWLIAGRTLDPLAHAAAWSEGELDEWLANLRDLGAEAVVEGAAILRRRDGARNWVRADTAPPDNPEPASAHIERVFAANDRLAELTDDDLLLTTPVLAPPHRIEVAFTARDGRRADPTTRLRLLDGLLFAAEIDTHTAELLVRLDGRTTLGSALAAVAGDAGLDAAATAPFAAQAAAIAREMLALGLLVLPEATGG